MNFLIFFIFCLINLNLVILAEQLYHREGRFIDFSLNRYKTQLPSIHDVTHAFIHYRMPIAVFVPTVRFNLRSKQKRIQYASFPTSKKTLNIVNENQPDSQNKSPVINEQEAQVRSNEKQETVSSPIISRTGWTARSLSKPRKFKIPRRNNLNYASTLPSESNVDLIPFLYKDSVQSQPQATLFNSQYQLANSNPAHMFSQNIAYIQPNSLASYQPNILVLNPSGQLELKPIQNKNDQSVSINNEQKNNSLPILNTTVPVTAESVESSQTLLNQSFINQPDQINKLASESSTVMVKNSLSPESSTAEFDVSQKGENPEEIVEENMQSNEPLENVPVSPISNSVDIEVFNKINNSFSNATQLISNGLERRERQLSLQPVQINPLPRYNNEKILDPFRPNLVKRFYSIAEFPISQTSNKIREKKLMPNRSQRSLIDLPSYA